MKKFLRILFRRPLKGILFVIARCLGWICYDKKYLTGRYFSHRHFTIGWWWVLRYWFPQKVLGENRHVPWPVPPWIKIGEPKNILFDPDDMQNFHGVGNYFQGMNGRVILGKGCYIAPGTGFITANHDPADADAHLPGRDIVLGEGCWIGMNAVILPGVVLGPHTSVGAGSVVTKSFPEGYCIILGSPARKIREVARDGIKGDSMPSRNI